MGKGKCEKKKEERQKTKPASNSVPKTISKKEQKTRATTTRKLEGRQVARAM
jgi:hypothetical protein